MSSTVLTDGSTVLARIDTYDLELLLVFDVIGKAKKTKSVLVASNPLHQYVVVLPVEYIFTAGFGFAYNCFREIVKGTQSGLARKALSVRQATQG